MGVRIGDASWSYGGFNSFRERLALLEGIRLDEMVGFGGETEWDRVVTPLKPLLNHSDCDGDLSPEECRTVAPRLRELLGTLNDPIGYDRRHGYLLAGSMEHCAAHGKRLEFT